MIAAWVAGQAAELVAVGVVVGLDPSFRERGRGHKRWRRALLRYRRFPTILVWAHLLEQLGSHLPTTLVSGGFGADVAGQFNLIQRIIARPVAIIGSSASVVLMSESSRAFRAGEPIRPVLVACLRRLTTLALVVFVPIAVIGPWLVPMVLGEGWSASGIYLLALLPGVAADFIVIPVFPLLGLVERLWTQLAGSVLRIGLVASAIMGFAEAGISATIMMLGVSGASIVAGVFGLVMCWRGTASDRLRGDRATLGTSTS